MPRKQKPEPEEPDIDTDSIEALVLFLAQREHTWKQHCERMKVDPLALPKYLSKIHAETMNSE